MKHLVLILFGFFIHSIVFAQSSFHYFSDHGSYQSKLLTDELVYHNQFLTGGGTLFNTPYIALIDTNGNTTWSTVTFDTFAYSSSGPGPQVSSMIIGADSFLYAVVGSYHVYYLWKVNPDSGLIVWQKLISTDAQNTPHIFDRNSDEIIVQFSLENGTNLIEYFSKNDGQIISTYNLSYLVTGYYLNNFAKDQNNDLYFFFADTLYKLSGSDPGQLLWKKSYGEGQVYEWYFYFDSTNRFFAYRRWNSVTPTQIIELDGDNGDVIDSVNIPGNIFNPGDYAVSSVTDKNDQLYFTLRPLYFGGGVNNAFIALKCAKNNLSLTWTSAVHFDGICGGFGNGINDGCYSLALDASDDVFLTGYCCGGDVLGSVAMAKVSGIDGSLIYQNIIIQDSTQNVYYSYGLKVEVINNVPYVLSKMEPYTNSFEGYAHMTKLENSNGEILLKKFISGSFQLVSKTVDIESAGNETYVLKQVGKEIEVDKYNDLEELLWKKIITHPDYLIPHVIHSGYNQTLYIGAVSKQIAYGTYPYYAATTDSIIVYELNSTNGDLLKGFSFYSGYSLAYPRHFLDDGLNAFLFYITASGPQEFVRPIDSNGFGTATNLSFSNDTLPDMKNFVDIDSSTFLAAADKIYSVDKSTLTKTLLTGTINSVILHRPTYFDKIGPDSSLLAGRKSGDAWLSYIDNVTGNYAWYMTYPNTVSFYKFIVNPDKKSVYILCEESDSSYSVRKIALSDGSVTWTATTTNPEHLQLIFTDIVLNPSTNLLTVTGYEVDTAGGWKTKALIQNLDTSGTILNTLVLSNILEPRSTAWCADVLPDNSTWVGGTLGHYPQGKSGFLYDSDTTFVVTIINESSSASSDSNLLIFPNPASESLSLKGSISTEVLPQGNYYIINGSGVMVLSGNVDYSDRQINVSHLQSGLYFLILKNQNSTICKTLSFVKM